MTDGPAATPPTRGVRAGPSASAPASAVRKQTRPGSLTWTWPASAPVPTRNTAHGPRSGPQRRPARAHPAVRRADGRGVCVPARHSNLPESYPLDCLTSLGLATLPAWPLPNDAAAEAVHRCGGTGFSRLWAAVGSGDGAEIDRAIARAAGVAVHGPSEFWARGLGDQQNRPRGPPSLRRQAAGQAHDHSRREYAPDTAGTARDFRNLPGRTGGSDERPGRGP